MSVGRFERKQIYLSYAQHALEQALKARDEKARKTWEQVAAAWSRLARMTPERCFCGRDAIGAKYYDGGDKVFYCAEHLTEALVGELKAKLGMRREN
jgi:hypothetical protein